MPAFQVEWVCDLWVNLTHKKFQGLIWLLISWLLGKSRAYRYQEIYPIQRAAPFGKIALRNYCFLETLVWAPSRRLHDILRRIKEVLRESDTVSPLPSFNGGTSAFSKRWYHTSSKWNFSWRQTCYSLWAHNSLLVSFGHTYDWALNSLQKCVPLGSWDGVKVSRPFVCHQLLPRETTPSSFLVSLQKCAASTTVRLWNNQPLQKNQLN